MYTQAVVRTCKLEELFQHVHQSGMDTFKYLAHCHARCREFVRQNEVKVILIIITNLNYIHIHMQCTYHLKINMVCIILNFCSFMMFIQQRFTCTQRHNYKPCRPHHPQFQLPSNAAVSSLAYSSVGWFHVVEAWLRREWFQVGLQGNWPCANESDIQYIYFFPKRIKKGNLYYNLRVVYTYIRKHSTVVSFTFHKM